VPATNVAELIAAIKATPGKFSYASPGTGTPPHLLGELFRLSLQLDMVHVPFSSGGQAIGSTLAGHTPISFGAVPPAVQHVKEGKLRALAVTSTAPSAALAGVPTSAQAGYPDFAADIWTAVLVPAGTPKEIITLLQREIAKVVAMPVMKDRMAALGYQPVGNTSEECAQHIASEATPLGQGNPRGRHQGALIMGTTARSEVADHYARRDLVSAIREGLARMGKTESTITAEDLAPVDEFHIGGRAATEELAQELRLTAGHRVLDVGCGLGGPARQIAARYECHVTGIDLTPDYVEAGNVLSGWLHLRERVSLQRGDALALPFEDWSFDAAYMLHVGMNIADKDALFTEIARVLRPGARFAVYDVMRTGDGELSYPLPWSSTAQTNAIAAPADYRDALSSAGFEVASERDRREVALDYFARQRAQVVAAGPAALGVHTLMGARRPEMVRNMSEAVAASRIAPVEIIAMKVGATV
jgi:ubiquinone/menaquinone biosynthesis C-methylase UbiE